MARPANVALSFKVAARETLAEIHRNIVAIAKREHAKVMRADPRPSSFRRWVDGREGAAEESVRANGVILYTYQRIDEVVRFAMQALFDHSPVRSGEYRRSHTIFLNGTAVRNLRDWKEGDEVVISNSVPYARKIELGKMKMRVPGTDHVYERSLRDIRRRFGNIARIDFGWRGIGEEDILTGALRNVSRLRFPALIITERG